MLLQYLYPPETCLQSAREMCAVLGFRPVVNVVVVVAAAVAVVVTLVVVAPWLPS